ncbi:MAG TPA: methyltransferase domain-containing protein [Acidimicrobiales bacterium]|nr:methyltransferase domain-containing protein [Acidimicrobiales bacterium]
MNLRSTVARVPGARRAYRGVRTAQQMPSRVRRRITHADGYFASLGHRRMVEVAYEIVLGRPADPVGRETALSMLGTGSWSPSEMISWLMGSGEFRRNRHFTGRTLGPSLHSSRCEFVRSLPAARNILDLGGTDLASPEGAMVTMGYPYRFETLTIVDLPPDERHEIYRADLHADPVKTWLGPVYYRYHSMTDLSGFADASVDLVYSGQSIEHVPPAEGRKVVKSVYRVLEPGGYFALDTPNGRVTRVQQPQFIDPDHKVEYTLEELLELVTSAGFEIADCKGTNLATDSVASGRFDADEVAGNSGLYSRAEDCYLLCVVARKPR